MIQRSFTRLSVAIGGVALAVGAGAGIASAQMDIGPAVNTTCNYDQLVAALNAQGPQVGAAFSQSPILQKGLRDFLGGTPDQRTRLSQQVVAAPAFKPYLPQIEQAFLTCNNF
jgi:hemophore-related protein